MDSEYKPASKAARAAARRRRRSLICVTKWEIDSDSVRGWWLTVVSEAEESEERENEKLSSDQQMLSRRNAAEAKRFPCWRSTSASSINPKWQQACPSTKYLQLRTQININHCVNSFLPTEGQKDLPFIIKQASTNEIKRAE